jgi:hypothetical protein
VDQLTKDWDADIKPDSTTDVDVTVQPETNREEVPQVPLSPHVNINDTVGVSSFQSQVATIIVPMLERETQNILNSIDREVDQIKSEINTIRRRFLSPFVTNSGEVIGTHSNPGVVRIPSISNFCLVNISDSDSDTDSDDECDFFDTTSNGDVLGCVKNFVTQVGNDLNHLSDAMFDMYKNVHRAINRMF